MNAPIPFDTARANARLIDTYEAAWPTLQRVVAETAGASGAHLVRVPEAWSTLPVRLAVVGQQTAGWDRRETAREQMDLYPGDGIVDGKRHTPFWRVAREMADALNDRLGAPILWCNLVAVDVHKAQPSDAVRNAVREAVPAHGLLRAVLGAARPDVVVFLTGPSGYYTWEMERQFPGVQRLPVDGCDERALCRLAHEALPAVTVRSHHPNYLQRSGAWANVARITDEIRALVTPRA